jgi:hypothetical protein
MCQFDPTRERATLLALVGTKLVTPANDLLGDVLREMQVIDAVDISFP